MNLLDKRKNIIEKLIKNYDFTIILRETFKVENITENIILNLCDVSEIKDVHSIVLFESVHMVGGIYCSCLFMDENCNIRYVEMFENLIHGMIQYLDLHSSIKKDLIESINFAYSIDQTNNINE